MEESSSKLRDPTANKTGLNRITASLPVLVGAMKSSKEVKSVEIDRNIAQDEATQINGDTRLESNRNKSTQKISHRIYINTHPAEHGPRIVEPALPSVYQTASSPDSPKLATEGLAIGQKSSDIQACATLSAEELTTYIKDFNQDGKSIQDRYKRLPAEVKSMQRYSKIRKEMKRHMKRDMKRDIKSQKGQFQIEFSALMGKIDSSNFPTLPLECQAAQSFKDIQDSLDNILKTQESFWQKIRSIHSDNTNCSGAPKDQLNSLRDQLIRIQKHLDQFQTLARVIIGEPRIVRRQASIKADKAELKRLSVEGQAAARLYACLSQCCPDDHSHTAIIYLKSGLGGNDSTASEENRTRTECHMAIKPTGSNSQNLIWLNVVSVLAGESSAALNETENVLSGDEYLSPRGEGRKRGRSNILEAPNMPLLKAAKTHEDQYIPRRISNSDSETSLTWSQGQKIQVCPACLAPHDGLPSTQNTRPVMLLSHSDDHTSEHHIFYLPVDKRPLAESPRMCFEQARGDLMKRFTGRKKWIARVARRVAESVLCFNWSDMRQRGPQLDSLVFYESTQKTFEPFIQLQIERDHTSGALEPDSPAAREKMLLNLGFLIFEVGRDRSRAIPFEKEKDKAYLVCMSEHKSVTCPQKGMGKRYASVIKSCAKFEVPVSRIDDKCVDEDGFRKTFFENIVTPLKEIEDALPES